MKILQLIQKPQLRGAEIFASQLSNHLVVSGHEVKMISLMAGDSTLPFAGEIVPLNRPPSKRLADVQGWRMLAREIAAFNPDVVQANAGDTLKYAVFSKLLFGWKARIVFRNANKVSDFITSKPQRWFNCFLVSRVNHVVSVSELCRQDFIKTYSYTPSKTTTVPIGIELQTVNNEIPHDIKQVFSAGNVLVHVASFVAEKNHSGLLRITEKLIARGIHIQLVLIGDGKLRPQVEQQIGERNLTGHVHVLGYRTDVLSLVSNARAFVLPSIIEGLPGVILEAMYCKTPVVAYDVGGVSEVVRDGETGWLVQKNDEEGFVKAVCEVLEEKDINRIIENAYDLVVREFDNRVIAGRFVDAYAQLTINN